MTKFEMWRRHQQRELDQIEQEIDELAEEWRVEALASDGTDLTQDDRAQIKAYVAALPRPKRKGRRGDINALVDASKRIGRSVTGGVVSDRE